MTCSHCQQSITTRTTSEASSLAWIITGVLCLVGCVPCCIIPLFVDSIQQVTHACPSCSIALGIFDPKL